LSFLTRQLLNHTVRVVDASLRRQYRPLRIAVIEDGQGRELAVVDLLANLMHLCDRDGFDFDELMAAADDHYFTEVERSD
jgi:hypothetical protein